MMPWWNNPLKSDSGSIQSHLSATNSQQRLRALTGSYPHQGEITYNAPFSDIHPETPEHSVGLASFIRCVTPGSRTSGGVRDPFSRYWSTRWLKWIAILYCLLSSVFLSIDMYRAFGQRHPRKTSSQVLSISPLAAVSYEHGLSRIIALEPPPLAFFPFVLRGHTTPDLESDITACLWTTDDEDLSLLHAWKDHWSGPISLLLVTPILPSSANHRLLLRKLFDLKRHTKRLSVSVHVLHVKSPLQASGNLYLNVARLFSLTERVMLLPTNLSVLPGPRAHSIPSSTRPHIISGFSSPALPPILVPRNHGLWCTERYFPLNTRQSDWQECIWQFWLEGQGNLRRINLTETLVEEPMKVLGSKAELNTMHRLRAQFRTESCGTAIRQLQVTEGRNARGVAWLKRFCSRLP